jgi:hypothetical protein
MVMVVRVIMLMCAGACRSALRPRGLRADGYSVNRHVAG